VEYISQGEFMRFIIVDRNINVSNTLFIIPTDAHNYKIIGMFKKQLEFRQLLRHVLVQAETIIRELFRA
jgi:hypothetical protein